MQEATNHNERLAVVEHRQDEFSKSMQKIEQWMHQQTENMTLLVKVQADQSHADRAIQRLYHRLDEEVLARRDQHEQTRTWAESSAGALSANTSWIGILKAIAIALVGGLIGGALNHLLQATGGGG